MIKNAHRKCVNVVARKIPAKTGNYVIEDPTFTENIR